MRGSVDFFGSYYVSGTAPLTGPLSFRVDYSGSGHYGPASRSFDIPVAKYAPTMALTAPSSADRAAPLTVTGHLAWPHTHVTTGAVHVVKIDLAHPSGYSVGTVPVAADGSVAFHDTPQVGGANTYAFTYDGGTSYLPVTASAKVQVSRAAPTLSVVTDAKSYHSGATVKVTAHLGTTYNSRSVALYDQPAGKSRTQLKSGKVDAHGNLVAYYKITRNTVFSAAFAGDYRYAPRTVTTNATLTPTVRTEMQWPLSTTRIGSTTYQVFYKSEVNMGFDLQVTPHQSGGCMSVYVEHYHSGGLAPGHLAELCALVLRQRVRLQPGSEALREQRPVPHPRPLHATGQQRTDRQRVEPVDLPHRPPRQPLMRPGSAASP